MKKLFVTMMVLALTLALLPAPATAQTEGDAHVVDLMAGQHIDVGDVKVWNDETDLYVKFESTGACLEETHVAVAESLAGIPQTRTGNPIVGRFPYSDRHGCIQQWKYTIGLKWERGTKLYIAAHAALGGKGSKGAFSTGAGETAWGAGEPFPGNNWAMYFTYDMTTPPPCTNVPVVINGGFETPVVMHSLGWDIYPSGTAGLGWTVEWYNGSASYGEWTRPEPARLEFHKSGTVVNAYEGNQYAELDTDWDGPGGALTGEPASVRIYQDLATCEGHTYALHYAWHPRPGHESQLAAFWDGNELNPASTEHNGWHVVNTTVVASGLVTRLEFVETGPADSYGMFLDAVSVTCAACP